ncbi:Histone-Lysine N-Methyltransferase ash1l [Nowakowskiella sp. JEL0407]|nr:Histone-Lysine N-Methyltransferase ash1l [Nowakowskiella sp. JEL0407]
MESSNLNNSSFSEEDSIEFYSQDVQMDIPPGPPSEQIRFFFNSSPPAKDLDELDNFAFPFWWINKDNSLNLDPSDCSEEEDQENGNQPLVQFDYSSENGIDSIDNDDDDDLSDLSSTDSELMEDKNLALNLREKAHAVFSQNNLPKFPHILENSMSIPFSPFLNNFLSNQVPPNILQMPLIPANNNLLYQSAPTAVIPTRTTMSIINRFFYGAIPNLLADDSGNSDQSLGELTLKVVGRLKKKDEEVHDMNTPTLEIPEIEPTPPSEDIESQREVIELEKQHPIQTKKRRTESPETKRSLRSSVKPPKPRGYLQTIRAKLEQSSISPTKIPPKNVSTSETSSLGRLRTRDKAKNYFKVKNGKHENGHPLIFGQIWRDLESEWNQYIPEKLSVLYESKKYLHSGLHAEDSGSEAPRLTFIKSISAQSKPRKFFGPQNQDIGSRNQSIESRDLIIDKSHRNNHNNRALRFRFTMPEEVSEMLKNETEFELPYDMLLFNNLRKENEFSSRSIQRRPPKPPLFKHINANIYVDRKPIKPDNVPVCACKPDPKAKAGCLEDCLNRCMLIECTEGMCPSGSLCQNRRFQKLDAYPGLEVFWTAGRGYGLRTKKLIISDTLIIEYRGEIISQQTCLERIRTDYANCKSHYLLDYYNGEVIDGTKKGTVARFVNHSCEPNCYIEKWWVNGEYRVGLFALHNITEGTELTYDYRFEAFGVMERCLCGSSKCRGNETQYLFLMILTFNCEGLIGVNKKTAATKDTQPKRKTKSAKPVKNKVSQASTRLQLQAQAETQAKNGKGPGTLIDFWLAPKPVSKFKTPVRLIENQQPYSTTFSMIESTLGKTFKEAMKVRGFLSDTKVLLVRNLRDRYKLKLEKDKQHRLNKGTGVVSKQAVNGDGRRGNKGEMRSWDELVDLMREKAERDKELARLEELCGDDLESISSGDSSDFESSVTSDSSTSSEFSFDFGSFVSAVNGSHPNASLNGSVNGSEAQREFDLGEKVDNPDCDDRPYVNGNCNDTTTGDFWEDIPSEHTGDELIEINTKVKKIEPNEGVNDADLENSQQQNRIGQKHSERNESPEQTAVEPNKTQKISLVPVVILPTSEDVLVEIQPSVNSLQRRKIIRKRMLQDIHDDEAKESIFVDDESASGRIRRSSRSHKPMNYSETFASSSSSDLDIDDIPLIYLEKYKKKKLKRLIRAQKQDLAPEPVRNVRKRGPYKKRVKRLSQKTEEDRQSSPAMSTSSVIEGNGISPKIQRIRLRVGPPSEERKIIREPTPISGDEDGDWFDKRLRGIDIAELQAVRRKSTRRVSANRAVPKSESSDASENDDQEDESTTELNKSPLQSPLQSPVQSPIQSPEENVKSGIYCSQQ